MYRSCTWYKRNQILSLDASKCLWLQYLTKLKVANTSVVACASVRTACIHVVTDHWAITTYLPGLWCLPITGALRFFVWTPCSEANAMFDSKSVCACVAFCIKWDSYSLFWQKLSSRKKVQYLAFRLTCAHCIMSIGTKFSGIVMMLKYANDTNVFWAVNTLLSSAKTNVPKHTSDVWNKDFYFLITCKAAINRMLSYFI